MQPITAAYAEMLIHVHEDDLARSLRAPRKPRGSGPRLRLRRRHGATQR